MLQKPPKNSKIKKIETRGGKREGSGRPKKPVVPINYSEDFKKGIMDALERKRLETGKSIYDIYADMVYSEKTHEGCKVSLLNSFQSIMVVKETKETINVHEIREVIMLPPIQPEKVIDIKEG